MKNILMRSVLIFIFCLGLWAQSNNIEPNILILDVTDSQFKNQAETAGWSTGHLMYRDNVTSSKDNFWGDVQVYSKDGIPLFSAMLQVKTRALAYGYLQLANYDRSNNKIIPLNKYPLSFEPLQISFPDNSPIFLNISAAELTSIENISEWITFHIMIGSSEVATINDSHPVPVFSEDNILLFTVATPAAEFIRKTGILTFANYKNRIVSKVSEIEIKK